MIIIHTKLITEIISLDAGGWKPGMRAVDRKQGINNAWPNSYLVTSNNKNTCMVLLILRYQIRPRYIRDISHCDIRMNLLGEAIDFPICVAPTGCQCFLHWEGEVATAKGIILCTVTEQQA